MPRPEPTSPPTRVELPKRGLSSWASSVAQGLPTDVASGILPAFQGLPSPDDIKEQLNLTDDSINQLPIQVLNIPSYANWTSSGWNVRIHGQAYRQPPANNETLDRISSIFIADLEVSSLNETGLQQSRNMSASMLALPAGDVNLNFTLTSPISNASLLIDFPVATDSRGEFDQFIQLNAQDVPTNTSVMSWPLYTVNVESGNTTMWFVPPEGISIVSDIDDILRFTQIYVPQQGLYNSFAVPFVPWSDMPNVYAAWAQGNPNYHFHYLTTTPEQFTRPYVDFQNKYYPLGSFDDRPLNLTTVDQIFSIRKVNLLKFYETFPNRKIVLVADTSNGDVMSSYPKMAMDYPNQTACILIRIQGPSKGEIHVLPYHG
ncbi:hypothetical protein FRC18_003989 [Serendipita sp. 400]|nr:hypothetical protein FRC18_003989 [Serendipita sp. 400]